MREVVDRIARRLAGHVLPVGGTVLASLAFLAVGTAAARAQDVRDDELFEQNRTTYGDIGLIEVPSARMASDGQLSLTIGDVDTNMWRIGLGFQVLPWMEASFRYNHIPHFFDDGGPVFDRSFGLKVRLFPETAYTPAVAIGARDIVGTGVYGQEFVVLSKRFWDVDVTAGLGWGRLASTDMFDNPLGLISDRFNTRNSNTGQGGTISFGQLFRGPHTSLFGGLNWQTPIDDLNLIVEYSSDRYLAERKNTHFFTRMPVNFAATYRVFDNVSLMGGYLYGTTWGGAITIHFDPKTELFPQRIGTPPPPPAIRDAQQKQSALDELNRQNQITTVNRAGLAVDLGTDPTELREILSAAPSSAARDYEIDGRTLAINVEGPADLDAQCRIFAQVAANSIPGIDTIAITELADHDGHVVLCPVQRRHDLSPAKSGPNSSLLPDPTAGAPVIDEGTLQFRPTITDPHFAEQKIREDIAKQHLEVDAVAVGGGTALVYVSNTKYFFEAEAIGRLTRILMQDTPADIEVFRIVSIYHGVPIRETKILRGDLERVIAMYGSGAELRASTGILDAPWDNPVLDAQQDDYPRFGWSLAPRLARSFFDPNQPARFGLFADLSAYTELLPGLTLETVLEGKVFSSLGSSFSNNSLLPHVRSDFPLYYSKGANGISNLDAVYRTRLAPDVYTEVKAGYLEDMFAGVGGQVLWRPNGERWALGADVYQVWQRDFDRLFGVRDYHVVTGHVTLYYESPWYGLNMQLHGGRYLAGDWGGTIQISRMFSTGIEVGAFATFTNVPFRQFGEGSFDKGVLVRIPLEWALPLSTQSSANFDFRPLTRDGGQRLVGDDSLYSETTRYSYGQIDSHLNDIVTP
ncbi:MAG: YjbH domain-containing protein [Alphaproteobacteria bacterium]|nr:YjbH domain-containing protein [Alphaproteobacteria bacterium]